MKKKNHEIENIKEDIEFSTFTSTTEKNDKKLSTVYELASNLEDASTIIAPSFQFEKKISANSLKVNRNNTYRKRSLEKSNSINNNKLN